MDGAGVGTLLLNWKVEKLSAAPCLKSGNDFLLDCFSFKPSPFETQFTEFCQPQVSPQKQLEPSLQGAKPTAILVEACDANEAAGH